jgi:dienelactone hydrolase
VTGTGPDGAGRAFSDQDKLMPSDVLADSRARISYWGNAQGKTYPRAGHSFTCPRGSMRHAQADRAAWNDAISFLSERMGA